MRRSVIASLVIPVLGLSLLGAPCATKGPQNDKQFAAKSLIIPMDNCYQKRDATSASGGQNTACNVTGDDGVLRAYGLVYLLLKKGVPVYWVIDGATPKGQITTADITVTPTAGGTVVKQFNWGSGQVGDYVRPGCSSNCGFPAGQSISYIGGPFVIQADDVTRTYTDSHYDVFGLLKNDPDIALLAGKELVDIHEVEYPFVAKQARPLSGSPPRIAILNIAGPRTSADVMINYARAAGFDWTCNGACTNATNCDCAGGISKQAPNCTKSQILSTYGITVNDGPGQVYDILCDEDFLPDYTNPASPDFTHATLLKKESGGGYVYKLLWAPHWETPRATCPGGTPTSQVCGTSPNPTAAVGTASRNLADWLRSIRMFVDAGNNLFAECHAIVTLEGGYGQMNQTHPIKEYGLPITQFQTTNTVNRSKNATIASGSLAKSVPAEPNMQIADFVFSVGAGNVSAFLADPNGYGTFTPALASSSYQDGVQHFIAESGSTPNLDVFTAVRPAASEGVAPGAVVYLGGHNYSPTGDSAINNTAGTRIVLNTLFNLGFACVEPEAPNNTCSTGLQGECAAGALKCAGGALSCTPITPAASSELCDGKDHNCDGVPGQICNPGEDCNNGVCVPKTCAGEPPRSCYDGPAGTTGGSRACHAGTQTCTGGVWGACTGQVLPGPAACNGKDNDCDGTVDTNCPIGQQCNNGICVPSICGDLEGDQCPVGYQCTQSQCVPVAGCGTCPPGQICNGSSCDDPCASVTCPQGTVCANGACQAGGCHFDPSICGAGKICSMGSCVPDSCSGVSCPAGTFCRAGDCVRSCESIVCQTGQVCGADGYCEPACSPACSAGQICSAGTCQADPCAGKVCGTGQVCSGGACVDDPCRGVTCQSGTCSKGQCPGQASQCRISAATTAARSSSLALPSQGAGSGCSSGSTGGLLSLLLMGLGTLVPRRRAWASGRSARLASAAVAVLLVAATGCKNGDGGKPGGCPTGQTRCGSTCVDLKTDAVNCGACGCGCQPGYSCAQGTCLLPTDNPYLTSITPSSAGTQSPVTLQLAGEGFKDGAQLRITGGGLDGSYDLTVNGPASATLSGLPMTNSHVGTAQVRVVNEPSGRRLISNALPFQVRAVPVLQSANPAMVRQDTLASTSVSVTLSGVGLTSGFTATLTPSGGSASQPLAASFVDAQHGQVQLPSNLAVGTYQIAVANPDSASSNALLVAVREGLPVLATPSPSGCRSRQTLVFTEIVTGQYLYPTSVAHVSGNGLSDAVLPTACVSGTDAATGRCQGGIQVTVDITLIQNGDYDVTIVNPGTPQRLASSPPLKFTIKDTCP